MLYIYLSINLVFGPQIRRLKRLFKQNASFFQNLKCCDLRRILQVNCVDLFLVFV